MTHWNCHLKQKRLAHLTAKAQDLTPLLRQHIEKCAECRAYWLEINAITTALTQQKSPATLSSDFDQRLWQRWQEAQKGASTTSLHRKNAIAWGTVSTVLVGIIAWGASSRSNHEKQAVTSNTTPVVVSAVSLQPKPAPIPPKEINAPKPHQIAFKPHKVRRTRTAKRRPQKPIFKPELQLVQTPAPQRPTWTWAQVGTWYAAQGEFANASRAFGNAWTENPTPQTAFIAGETAELSGDTMQALDYYSRSLMTQPETEKDSERKDKQDGSSITPTIRRYCLSPQHGESASTVCPHSHYRGKFSGCSSTWSNKAPLWTEQPDRAGSIHSHARLPLSLEEDKGDICTTRTPRA